MNKKLAAFFPGALIFSFHGFMAAIIHGARGTPSRGGQDWGVGSRVPEKTKKVRHQLVRAAFGVYLGDEGIWTEKSPHPTPGMSLKRLIYLQRPHLKYVRIPGDSRSDIKGNGEN